jgi:RimJ/RimL family protein N-acetyltransferase
MTRETPRLILREWELTDFEPYAAMVADPAVMKFLSLTGTPMPRFGAWQTFSAIVGHWQLRGFGVFAVTERNTGALVGDVGPWNPERVGERLDGEIHIAHHPPELKVLQFSISKSEWAASSNPHNSAEPRTE